MCTVSVIPTNDAGYRLISNRDESLARPHAEPPERRAIGNDRLAIWPTDPVSGGTWIGANDEGLVLAILNHYPDPAPPTPQPIRSRGTIIPAIIESIDAARAAACLHDMDLSPYAPFRLLAVDARRVVVVTWNRAPGQDFSIETFPMAPLCLVCSSLGDARVRPRLDLWNEMVIDAGHSVRTQDEFHTHAWPDRLNISVMMQREDAKTVSRTAVRVRTGTVEMAYLDPTLGESTVSIPRAAGEPAPDFRGSIA